MNSEFKVFESDSTKFIANEIPGYFIYLDEEKIQDNTDSEVGNDVLEFSRKNTRSETDLSSDGSQDDSSEVDFEYLETHQLDQLDIQLNVDFDNFVEKCLDEDEQILKSMKYPLEIMTKPKENDNNMPALSDLLNQIDCTFAEKPLTPNPQELQKRNSHEDMKKLKLYSKFKRGKSLSMRLSYLPQTAVAKMEEENQRDGNLQLQLARSDGKIEEMSKVIELVDQQSQLNDAEGENAKFDTPVMEQISQGQSITPEQKDKRFRCKKCKFIGSLKDIKMHIIMHEKHYKCKLCENVYRERSDLKCHMETHKVFKEKRSKKIKRMQFPCDECNYVGKHESNLRRHKLTHLKVKVRHYCSFCSYSSPMLSILQKHQEQHKNTPLFPCETCSFKAKTLETLRNHKQTHVEEKVFKCTKCPYSFYRKSNLTEHLRKHNGLNPIQCNLCTSSFTRKSNLFAHKRKFH